MSIVRLLERAAYQIVAGPSSKFIERLSNGGKGRLSLDLMKEALPRIGWSVEDAYLPTLIKSQRLAEKFLTSRLLEPLGASTERQAEIEAYSNGMGGLEFFFTENSISKLDEIIAKIPSLVSVVKKPSGPYTKEQIFTTKPYRQAGPPGGRGDRVTIDKVWVVTEGFKLTAPDGASEEFAIPITETPQEFTATGPWTFLYEHGALEAAKKAIESGDVDVQIKRPPGFKGQNTDVGTCPICGNMQVIHDSPAMVEGLPGMVMHGYSRPGYGYIVGQCPGIRWPPWEVSPKGLENFVETKLVPYIEKAKDKLAEMRAATDVEVLYADPSKQERAMKSKYFRYKIDNTNQLTQTSDEPMNPEHATILGLPVFSREKPTFESAKHQIISGIERNIRQASEHLKESKDRIENWEEQPLPGAQLKKQAEEEASGLCPGSGKPLEKGTLPNGKTVDPIGPMSRFGGLCSVCKKLVGPSSVRNHHGNGIAKKHPKS